jgi:hypothetical protein
LRREITSAGLKVASSFETAEAILSGVVLHPPPAVKRKGREGRTDGRWPMIPGSTPRCRSFDAAPNDWARWRQLLATTGRAGARVPLALCAAFFST